MSFKVRIVEVSPRDGLQSESVTLPTEVKLELVQRLIACGLKDIEVAAFVRPDRLPQLADADELCHLLGRPIGVQLSALVPNLKGLERAHNAGIEHINFFTAASETFCEKNIGCSIEKSLRRCKALKHAFREFSQGRLRAYISCAFGCPYEGVVDPHRVADLVVMLVERGCDEIVMADTVGVATPTVTYELLDRVTQQVPVQQIALHLHDTRGQALANVYACLEQGIGIVDSAVAGLGGCPYAPGATGNLATEDLVYMLEGCGVNTGIDLDRLIETGRFISAQLGRSNQSRVGVSGKGI